MLQGATAALLFPAAVGIVVASFPLRERGKAMAIFFGISGGLTAIGPAAGGYLTQWTWRAIFWINIPVAIIALVLIWISKPENERRPTKLDYRGTVLDHRRDGPDRARPAAVGGVGLEQLRDLGCIVIGAILMVAFVLWELRTPEPLLRLQIFRDRGFSAETAILGMISVAFVPFFFFASVYAQVSLGENASHAGLYILYFFIGFVILAQVGGRILDRRGAKPAVVGGCALAALGLLPARRQDDRPVARPISGSTSCSPAAAWG